MKVGQCAIKYLGMARQSLSRTTNPWEEYYDTTLRVYQAIAEAELCLGNFDFGLVAGQTLIGRATSLEDKLPTYLAICKAFDRTKKHKEAFDMGLDILRIMGAIPKCGFDVKMRLVKNFIAVKRFFARHSDGDILAIPLLKDKRLETIMELWSVVGISAYYCGAMLDLLISNVRMLMISFTKGLSPFSVVAMTSYSLFSNATNDIKGAHRFSRLARDILDVTKDREHACIQSFAATHHLYSWRDPPDQTIDSYETTHKLGMESGDFENGLMSQVAGYYHAFVTGHALADLEMNYLSVMKKLRLYNIKFVHAFAEEQVLPIQYLRGTAERDFDPTLFADSGPTGTLDNVTENFRRLFVYLGRIQLAVYFNEDDLAFQSLHGIDRIPDTDTSFGSGSARLFFCSLAYATLYRNRRKRSYLNNSRRCLSRLKRIFESKGTVCWHRCALMEAHLEAAEGRRPQLILPAFDRAIETARRNGHHHDAALGSQLAAEYCLSVMQRTHTQKDSIHFADLRRYFQQARDLYKSWGAFALVNYLEDKHRSFRIDATA